MRKAFAILAALALLLTGCGAGETGPEQTPPAEQQAARKKTAMSVPTGWKRSLTRAFPWQIRTNRRKRGFGSSFFAKKFLEAWNKIRIFSHLK